jgi:hypothetical protein
LTSRQDERPRSSRTVGIGKDGSVVSACQPEIHDKTRLNSRLEEEEKKRRERERERGTHLEVLIARTRPDRTPVWTQRRTQHSAVVRAHLPHLLEGRVGPEADVVVREAVAGENLFRVGGEDETGDLRGGREGGDPGAGRGGP